MVLPGGRRSTKYGKKLSGDVAKMHVDASGTRQKRTFASSIRDQVRIEQDVKTILRSRVSTLLLPYYIIMAKEVNAAMKKYKGTNLMTEVVIIDDRWESRGLDPYLCYDVKKHYIPSIVVPSPFRLDDSLLDGNDKIN